MSLTQQEQEALILSKFPKAAAALATAVGTFEIMQIRIEIFSKSIEGRTEQQLAETDELLVATFLEYGWVDENNLK